VSAGQVTIRDIGEALRISHTTVSRALADHPKISVRTKTQVKAMAARMGYIPHASARTMRGGHSAVVGLIIPDVQNDFFSSVAKIVADTLAANGMQLMLCVTEDSHERELRELRALIEARPSGVIVVPTATPMPETLDILNNINTVQLVRMHPKIMASAVLMDDRMGTMEATRHLLDDGHRQLAYMGSPAGLNTGHDRLAGFRDALQERGLRPAFEALGPPRPVFARQAISAMMARLPRPTALVLGSPELTLGALQALRAAMLEWPRDISIVGYHDPAWFELLQGGITTLRLPVQQIAATATGALLAQTQRGHVGLTQAAVTVRFPSTLILRGSTAPLR
jgi:LacI family transcriptional regulator